VLDTTDGFWWLLTSAGGAGAEFRPARWGAAAGSNPTKARYAMPTIKAIDDARRWQTFSVIGRVIARNQAARIEGVLELAGNQALVFLFDLGEAYWTWLPEEPESTLNQAENEEGAD